MGQYTESTTPQISSHTLACFGYHGAAKYAAEVIRPALIEAGCTEQEAFEGAGVVVHNGLILPGSMACRYFRRRGIPLAGVDVPDAFEPEPIQRHFKKREFGKLLRKLLWGAMNVRSPEQQVKGTLQMLKQNTPVVYLSSDYFLGFNSVGCRILEEAHRKNFDPQFAIEIGDDQDGHSVGDYFRLINSLNEYFPTLSIGFCLDLAHMLKIDGSDIRPEGVLPHMQEQGLLRYVFALELNQAGDGEYTHSGLPWDEGAINFSDVVNNYANFVRSREIPNPPRMVLTFLPNRFPIWGRDRQVHIEHIAGYVEDFR